MRRNQGAPPVSIRHLPSYSTQPLPNDTKERLRHIFSPHVDSFNYFLQYGINEAVSDVSPMEFLVNENNLISMRFDSVQINYPTRSNDVISKKLTPCEARESRSSYTGLMTAAVTIEVNGEPIHLALKLGDLPIMIMSQKCHLYGFDTQTLMMNREEGNEMGGYFILNGIERVIRLLQVPRRNYAAALERNSFKNRGPSYSDKGVAMRCVRPDQSSVTLTLHYLNNGGCTMKFVLRKQEFLLPVILVAKALADISDKELFERIVQHDMKNTFLTARIELLLRDFKSYELQSKSQCQAYLGALFRGYLPISERTNDMAAGAMLIRKYFFVHTDAFSDKLECLFHMVRKLFSFAEGKCLPDNADALMNHELLLPGHLINMIIKEKLEEALLNVRLSVMRDHRENQTKSLSELSTSKYYQKHFDRFASTIGNKVGTFLSTGNIVSSTGLDLMQVSGYTIVAERLNYYRYLSHFQSVHRGQFFTTMKTTTVRKLLPESWGFLCPVHTPDGGPCGLLNHMAKEAVVVSYPTKQQMPYTADTKINIPTSWKMDLISTKAYVQDLLVQLGMTPAGFGANDGQAVLTSMHLPVLYDGVVIGGVDSDEKARLVVQQLRYLKATGAQTSHPVLGTTALTVLSDSGSNQSKLRLVDPTMEVAYFPKQLHAHEDNIVGPFAGIYLFTAPGRMIRPVLQLQTHKIEWIGPMEQIFMDIACITDDVRSETTHIELQPTTMLSHIASLTPFSDYNQSPRNMYQCQMGKQTMGTPSHLVKCRTDNKLYKILNTQVPLVQTQTHSEYSMDEYPQGCNAVVAVISFTGYDMEDAMIINKAAFERGFGHGSVFKTTIIDLDEEEKHGSKTGMKPNMKFSNLASDLKSLHSDTSTKISKLQRIEEELDFDGLPAEGTKVEFGTPLCCLVDQVSGVHRIIKHKDHESAIVDTVRLVGNNFSSTASSSSSKTKKANVRKVSITLRYNRNPVIGDKFSSRHGQKGTLSVLWPQQNMPFTESGMTPDVLINPHAFPSRMTIGMLIESMAGKSGAMYGKFQDATPFSFHENNRVIEHVGAQLRGCGYHYYGSEPLYNGLTGNVMHADIFIGLVYYQRLRHMVSDKSQVRSTGPVAAMTRQPVKGRKKHGGIRLGEMERDALISHGVAFCLQDRLMNCSDAHLAYVCAKCGSLLTVYPTLSSDDRHRQDQSLSLSSMLSYQQQHPTNRSKKVHSCVQCNSATHVRAVYLPYVFRYLTNELAGMGIKLTLKLTE